MVFHRGFDRDWSTYANSTVLRFHFPGVRVSCPVSILKSVVLPAPFGPTRDGTGGTMALTPSINRRSPKPLLVGEFEDGITEPAPMECAIRGGDAALLIARSTELQMSEYGLYFSSVGLSGWPESSLVRL